MGFLMGSSVQTIAGGVLSLVPVSVLVLFLYTIWKKAGIL